MTPWLKRATVGELAEIRRDVGLYAVNRFDRNRAVSVRCDIVEKTQNPDKGRDYIPDDIFEKLREKILPMLEFQPVEGDYRAMIGKPSTEAEGVRATFTGENEERDKSIRHMRNAMPCKYVLL